jgi:hypothetical protein
MPLPQLAIQANEAEPGDGHRLARVEVSLPGCYSLTTRRNLRGERRVFSCHSIHISCETMALVAPVSGFIGERVIATFDDFGKLEGKTVRRFGNGFEMRLILGASERKVLSAKIDWLQQHRHLRVPDRRLHRRIVPSHPHSTVLLADGRIGSCIVTDISASGAALFAELSPQLGDVLAVGKIIGRVVRTFPGGFAIRFVELQEQDALERLLISS